MTNCDSGIYLIKVDDYNYDMFSKKNGIITKLYGWVCINDIIDQSYQKFNFIEFKLESMVNNPKILI